MAKTFTEVIAGFDKVIDALPGLILKETEKGALGALALVDLRITETGINSTGSKFVDYTPAYKKAKTKKGRYRGFVDFQDSGQMLASTTTGFENIQPTQRSVTNANANVSFDGRDQFTRNKLSGNNKTRPGFLNPSADEMRIVTKTANEELEKDIKELLA